MIWGGSPECSHKWGTTIKRNTGTLGNNLDTLVGTQTAGKAKEANELGNFCSLCGAWRGAYGLEPSVELYVAHSIEILREIRRVLRKDGVVFWNCGDSYYSSPSNQQGKGNENSGVGVRGCQEIGRVKLPRHETLKPKDLCLIPFRIALAAQSDGWWVRSDIIWNKPNPMPESVTDRPTDCYEHIFLFTKSAKYYWDAEAVREPQKLVSIQRAQRGHDTPYNPDFPGGIHNHISEYYKKTEGKSEEEIEEIIGGRNCRNVWDISTHGYSGSHFATFPEKLPEICIKAATPEAGCCSKCGKPWERIVERKSNWQERKEKFGAVGGSMDNGNQQQVGHGWSHDLGSAIKTLGWQPGCKCNADKVPSIVLDPFCGSGTTLEVAAKLGRKAIGYEISEDYSNLIIERNRQGVIV